MERPTLRDVLDARKTIAPYVSRTPLISYAALDSFIGAEVRLKHENHHPLGAFKVRGGINFLAHLSEEQRRRGLTTASTGNHGQSVANACRLFGAKAVIVVPKNANPLKVKSMENLGAEVLHHGGNFDEARGYSERLAKEEGYRYVHAADEPLLVAGVATFALEIIEDFPDVEYILVPLGGGSGAAGASIVAKAVNPNIRVVAVQSEQAPAGYLSWKNRRITEAPMHTIAEGLATQTGYELPQSIIWDLLDDFLLVSDEEIACAIAILIEKAHTLAEEAGAAALAGAIKMKDELKGKRVAVVVTGSNITLDRLKEALDLYRGG
ncbi:MAG: threonine/serine dehydratase [Chloroflexi bacterium]|nr:threonine/serine dehydratase [Chloroflexota bacterium]